MTKSDLIDNIYNAYAIEHHEDLAERKNKVTFSRGLCEDIIDTFIKEVTICLADGENLIVKNFAGFEVVDRPSRTGRNPQTGEVMTFPPSKAVKVKMSKTIKEAVNGKRDIV